MVRITPLLQVLLSSCKIYKEDPNFDLALNYENKISIVFTLYKDDDNDFGRNIKNKYIKFTYNMNQQLK